MIKLKNVVMEFGDNHVVTVLNDLTFEVARNDWISILGVSGSGKTTLLNLIAGLHEPTSGSIEVIGKSLNEMKQMDMQEYRRNNIGFIYQDFKLFNQYTAIEHSY